MDGAGTGGALCTLLSLLAEHRCSLAGVAAALAFAPPSPPSYLLRRARHPAAAPPSAASSAASFPAPAAGAGASSASSSSSSSSASSGTAYEWVLDEGLEPASWPDTLITEVLTRRRRKIPVFVFVFAGAPLTLLYSHGNATDAGHMRAACVDLCANLRCNVVLYDYTGYGAAAADGAQPSEADCYADVEAVYDFCLRPGGGGDGWGCRGPEQVVLYGESIGSGPACWLARRRPCRALVLHAPVLSGLRVVLDQFPQRHGGGGRGGDGNGRGRAAELAAACLRPCDVFPNLHRVAGLRAGEVLVLHGLRDEEVDVSHGLRLHAALPPRYRQQHTQLAHQATGASAVGAGKDAALSEGGIGGSSGDRDAAADAAAVAAAADHAAPWFPALAGHNNVRELYRAEYFLRLRAFLLMLGTVPAAAPAPMAGGARKETPPSPQAPPPSALSAAKAEAEPSPARRGISREALAFLRAPLFTPRANGPIVAALQSSATAPPGPGSQRLEAAPGASLIFFAPPPPPPPRPTAFAAPAASAAESAHPAAVAVPSPLALVAAQVGLSVTAMLQAYHASAEGRGVSADADGSGSARASAPSNAPLAAPPPSPPPALEKAQQRAGAGPEIPARKGSVLELQQQQRQQAPSRAAVGHPTEALSTASASPSARRRASLPAALPPLQAEPLPMRLLRIAALRSLGG